jgi:hypothetical protein
MVLAFLFQLLYQHKNFCSGLIALHSHSKAHHRLRGIRVFVYRLPQVLDYVANSGYYCIFHVRLLASIFLFNAIGI